MGQVAQTQTSPTYLPFTYSSLEGASHHLVNFVLSCLQEEKVAHPSGMEEMLKDLLGNGKKLELSSATTVYPTKNATTNSTLWITRDFCGLGCGLQ